MSGCGPFARGGGAFTREVEQQRVEECALSVCVVCVLNEARMARMVQSSIF